MPWVRFADDYLSNTKVATLGAMARLLDVSAIIYSARELRDGQLSAVDVQMVATLAHVPRWQPAAAELVSVGRWLECEGGYAIHDYLLYQPSREQVLAKRAADAERMRRIRSSPGVRPNVTPEFDRSPATPVPDPDPDRSPGLSQSRSRPRAPDAAPPRRAPTQATENTEPATLRPEQQQCPLCPEVFSSNDALRDHMDHSPRHKVRPVAEDLTRKRSSSNGPKASPTPAEVAAELEAMARRPRPDPAEMSPELLAEHERFLAQERAKNGASA